MAAPKPSRNFMLAYRSPGLIAGNGVGAIWPRNGGRFGDHSPLGDQNRDRGDASRLRPSHTTGRAGPHPAVRRVELSVHSQAWNPKRVEVSIRQRDAERGRVRQPPWAEGTTRRLSGQVCTHTPLA